VSIISIVSTAIAHELHTKMEFIRYENLSPKPIRWTYTVAKLEAKLGML